VAIRESLHKTEKIKKIKKNKAHTTTAGDSQADGEAKKILVADLQSFQNRK
jgi:hypothetical protein